MQAPMTSRFESVIDQTARVLSRHFGIRVEFENGKCLTNWDKKLIILPVLPDELSPGTLSLIRAHLDHEVAHVIFTDFDEFGSHATDPPDRARHFFGNVIEDQFVNRKMGERLPGAALNLARGTEFFERKASEACQADNRNVPELLQFAWALGAMVRGKEPPDSITDNMCEAVGEITEEDLQGIRSVDSTRDALALADQIWERVRHYFVPPPPPPNQQEGEPSDAEADAEADDGETGTGAGTQNKEGDKEKDKDQQDNGAGTGAQGQDEEKDKDQQGATGENEPEEKDEQGQADKNTGGNEPEQRDGKADQTGGTDIPVPPTCDEFLQALIEQAVEQEAGDQYRPFSTLNDTVETPMVRPNSGWQNNFREGSRFVAGVRARLLTVMLGRDRVAWRHQQRRGKLDPHALYKLAVEQDTRIFRKEIRIEGGECACTLLLDISSSMNGEKLKLCAQVGMIFGEALSRLEFPTEIIGFSTGEFDSGDPSDERYHRFVSLHHVLYKGFDETWRIGANRLSTMTAMSLTPIGESLLFAGKRLAQRKEYRKLLFCVTDGQPTVGVRGDSAQHHAVYAAKRLAQAGIEPIGIGIGTSSVTHIFPQSVVLTELSDIPRGFMTKMTTIIIGSTKEQRQKGR